MFIIKLHVPGFGVCCQCSALMFDVRDLLLFYRADGSRLSNANADRVASVSACCRDVDGLECGPQRPSGTVRVRIATGRSLNGFRTASKRGCPRGVHPPRSFHFLSDK